MVGAEVQFPDLEFKLSDGEIEVLWAVVQEGAEINTALGEA